MRKILNFLSLAAILLVSRIAYADDSYYHFSYEFSHGEKVQGSMRGEVEGDIITNLHINSIYFTFADTSIPAGNFYPGREHNIYLTLGNREWDISKGGITSLDGLKNTFVYGLASSQVSMFYLYSLNGSDIASAMLHQPDYGLSVNETYDPNRWTLTPAPVPEPATYAMILLGSGLLGITIRRRKNNKSCGPREQCPILRTR